ncbi:hypothetical protein NHP190012_13580 [Helicobacter sp. NHP19-012]|uniref:Outer membrane protein n=1 Tax=Helicobacter gastrofelis TaxID=2849642 RepID=A0ABM7SFR9_9HELI|nr:hypothetical protein [Helicobacter sp. NHP19-012]BCZ19716.1 hypothetical protein NHP190012_13580 [Helicobacter sp. NHP19-012]
MEKRKLYQSLSVCLCVSLSPLACEDIRNGFFIGGSFGAKNEVLSTYQDVPTSPNTINKSVASSLSPKNAKYAKYADLSSMVQRSDVTSLQAVLKKDLQKLVQALDTLNTEVAKVGVSDKVPSTLSSINVADSVGKCNELQERIEAEIQALQVVVNVAGMPADTIKANQEIIEQYSNTLTSLRGFEKKLASEVSDYNQQLALNNEQYKRAQSVYQQDKQAYDNNFANYTAKRNKLVDDLKSAAARDASVDGVAQVHDDLNKLINADPHYREGTPRTDYHIAMNEGGSRVIKVDGLGESVYNHGFERAFLGLLDKLHVSRDLHDLNLLGLVACETWFVSQLDEIGKLRDPSRIAYLKGQLSEVYRTNFSVARQVFTGSAYTTVIPTADSVFKAPTVPSGKFSFSYINYATGIKDANTVATIKAVTSVPTQHTTSSAVHANLGSFVDTINGASKFYSNVGYNTSLIAGYQHFFGRRLGFSMQASAGYEWMRSPLFQKNLVFKRMQGAQATLGGDFLYDFKAPATQSGLYCGLFLGLLGTNNHYFLTTRTLQTHWKYSFNLHWNAGLRFQVGNNILRLGVSSPLIHRTIDLQAGSTHFLVHETFHNFNLYASYAVLFGN